ncbi:MAG: TolC family protein, partial [Prevotellaceae bacterium]|nr:TolC family protein [Prevotellaceae bacterium]
MKRIFAPVLFFLGAFTLLSAQNLTLDSCQQWARANYPLIKQYDLIGKSERYNLNNANKNYLPQVSLSARATYQSDVTSIDIPEQFQSIISFDEISNDQYQALLEVSQLIWDGGLTASKKKIDRAESQIDKQKVEVELYAVKDRVNQLFFGILLLNEQGEQLQMLSDELQSNYERVETYIKNGVANQSDLDALRVEQLNVKQRQTQLRSARKAYVQMLSILTGKKMDENLRLQKPEAEFTVSNANSRPEMLLFDAQSKLFDSRRSMLNAGNMPRIGAFVQGG